MKDKTTPDKIIISLADFGKSLRAEIVKAIQDEYPLFQIEMVELGWLGVTRIEIDPDRPFNHLGSPMEGQVIFNHVTEILQKAAENHE